MEFKFRNNYCFNNAVRHFLYIDDLIYPEFQDTGENLSWASPIKLKIKKDYESNNYRIIKMPNILNFKYCYEYYKTLPNFDKINDISRNSRMSVNYNNGTFKEKSYSKSLNKDLQILCVYDRLLKMDIKSFYDRIYNHIVFALVSSKDRYYSSMNNGDTNGLILGNYISLYFAEIMLKKISDELEEKIQQENINVTFSYFSDDFYFFCDKKDVEKIETIFNEVLVSNNFSESEDKRLDVKYDEYNNDNIIDRYWKKIINCQNENNEKWNKILEERNEKVDSNKNKYYYLILNQLLYRASLLEKCGSKNSKKQNILVNGFFKSMYWYILDESLYKFTYENVHQLTYIYKEYPETILYSVKKFKNINSSLLLMLKKNILKLFEKTLDENFEERQLYFAYACLTLYDDFEKLPELFEKVIKSKNQLLISYLLFNSNSFKNYTLENNIANLLNESEDSWFVNYHYLLLMYNEKIISINDLANYIVNYLLPKATKKGLARKNYLFFYSENLKANKKFIAMNNEVITSIDTYLRIRNHYKESTS